MTVSATFSVALANETATAQLMADLALLVGPGDVITLSGDLGAGKTSAARAMIRYLAGDETLEVPSPTFTLAQNYEFPFPIVHADLYRIHDSTELEEIGHRHRLQPSSGLRIQRARRRIHRPWQGRGAGRAAASAAPLP
jgi:tRNA threonylcarbamoyl adenosine modification protein YjeE